MEWSDVSAALQFSRSRAHAKSGFKGELDNSLLNFNLSLFHFMHR